MPVIKRHKYQDRWWVSILTSYMDEKNCDRKLFVVALSCLLWASMKQRTQQMKRSSYGWMLFHAQWKNPQGSHRDSLDQCSLAPTMAIFCVQTLFCVDEHTVIWALHSGYSSLHASWLPQWQHSGTFGPYHVFLLFCLSSAHKLKILTKLALWWQLHVH